MQHVQAEDIADAVFSKWEPLRVSDHVEPGATDEVRRKYFWRKLLEKTWTAADLDGDASRFAMRKQPRKKFLAVDAPQNGLLLPNAAVPQKLFLSLRIHGHGAFLDCTEFRGGEPRKLARWFRQVTNAVGATLG